MLFAMRAACLVISLALAVAEELWVCCCNQSVSSLHQADRNQNVPSFYQLEAFKNSTRGPIGTLTTTYGTPVSTKEAENSLDIELLDNVHLLEEITSFNRKRIPQRIVHAKGAGAHGYFEVTHDVTNVTNAALFSKIGKITPVSARFSVGISDLGTPDTTRGPFSIAAKFFTEEGNWDFLGFSTDVVFAKDPLFFASVLHARSKNPQSFLANSNSYYDLLSLRPESIGFLLQISGDPGAPRSYRHIPSHTIHTFQVENDNREMSMVRFQMRPDLGEEYSYQTEFYRIAGIHPNYFTQDLYDAIARCDYPSWTLYMQVMPEAEIETAGIDIYDVTVRWPLYKWPLRPIGKFVANKNPNNYFAEIEQLAFNPGNLVPGIRGVDKMFKARTMSYRDAQLYRLGANFNKIKVNCPLSPVDTYTRDGRGPVGDNSGGIPNYYPNTFNGPVPTNNTRTKTKRVQPSTVPEATNMDQAKEYYKCLSDAAKTRLAMNLANGLSMTYPIIRQRFIAMLDQVDPGLAADVSTGLAEAATAGRPPLGGSFTKDYSCPVTSASCHV